MCVGRSRVFFLLTNSQRGSSVHCLLYNSYQTTGYSKNNKLNVTACLYKHTEFILQIERVEHRTLEIYGYFYGCVFGVDSTLPASYGLSGSSLEDLEKNEGTTVEWIKQLV